LEIDLTSLVISAHSSDAPPKMAVDSSCLPLVAILGPTASGKSSLAVTLAEEFGGEVIACDSTQVYRGFDIGTAKPSAADRRGIPHHMLDVVTWSEVFTAGEYRQRTLEVLADLRLRQRLPVLTVGTGLYFRALTQGLADAPTRCEELRTRLNAIGARRGGVHLHKLLRRLDPAGAERISPNDRQKLVRAIEVCLLTGRAMSEVHRAGREPLQGYAALKIGLNPPRHELYKRIEKRVRLMLQAGWTAEVNVLVAQGAPLTSKPFEFIGYRELRDQVDAGQLLPHVTAAIAQATRRYAKRQLTWFRRESDVRWFPGFGDAPETLSGVMDYLKPLLARSADAARHGQRRQAV
jgi:tRNA dimethylallyltransferase